MKYNKEEILNMTMDPADELKWNGQVWVPYAENGRIMHPEVPWYWYNKNKVWIDSYYNMHLSCGKKEVYIKYWDGLVHRRIAGGGFIRTKESFKYGRFSADILLPKGRNLWSSFWMSSSEEWPPEFDVCEAESNNKGSYLRVFKPSFPFIQPRYFTPVNYHYATEISGHLDIKGRCLNILKQPKNPSDNFIKYEVVWTPDEIVFITGGKIVHKVDKHIVKYANKPMWLIFNCLSAGEKFSVESDMIVKNLKINTL